MSNRTYTSPAIRWRLLSTVSALALIASAYPAVAANDADRPQIWIDLGGEADSVTGLGEAFTPSFLADYPNSSVLKNKSPTEAQKRPFAFGEDIAISFQPNESDWIFTGSLRYARVSHRNEVDHQTNRAFRLKYVSGIPYYNSNIRGIDKFADTHVHQSDRNTILDFTAGKDVGLGMFGTESSSVLSVGVRFAQFQSGATFDIRARPEVDFKYGNLAAFGRPEVTFQLPYYRTYHATEEDTRSFHGLGPMLVWSGSAPFAGNPQDGELTLDWGINGALLFGKQKAHVKTQQYQRYVSWQFAFNGGTNYHSPYPIVYGGHDNVRSVTVPNVGGSIGLSYRYQDAKLSLGYRADFFFGAMDTGIDAANKSTLGFKGPYASISIGIGD